MELLPQILLNIVIAGAIYALVALGFNLIYGTVRFFDLGYGAITAVGGYGVYLAMQVLGMGVVVSIVASIVIAGLFGVAIYWLVYAPLRRRKATNMVLLVASLGVMTALQALVAIFFTSQFQTLSPGGGGTLSIGGGVITHIQMTIVVVALAIMVGLVVLLTTTSFGRSVRAIADDEEVAKIVGINTTRVIAAVFFIGSAIGAVAGILVGFDTGIEPTMGLTLLLKGVIASIIGGVGNIYGGVAGAFLLAGVENLAIWQVPVAWKDAIAFALLIVFLLVRPRGIFNSN